MPFNNTLPRSGRVHFHEVSSQASLRERDAVGRQWQKNKENSGGVEELKRAVALLTQQINRLRRRAGGEGGGWNWAPKPEYDSDTDYIPNQVVIVSSTNPAVTAGVSGVFASAGKWVCVRATNDGSGVKHLPTPEPDPATGTDKKFLSTVFWINIGASDTCPYG